MTSNNNVSFLSHLKVGLLLSIVFCVCITSVIVLSNYTSEIIASNNGPKEQQRIKFLLQNIKYQNIPNKECYLVNELFGVQPHKVYVARNNNKIVGYIVEYDVVGGYSTPFSMVAGVKKDGTITNIDIVQFNETPGLGDKIFRSQSNFLDSFKGKNLNNATFDVKKDGGDFDYFTGATVTPRAVVRSTKNMLEKLNTLDIKTYPKCQ